MTNSSSSSKLPISQEIKTPSSFNFSIPPPEESPSTPGCGIGETGESNTPFTEAQSVVKPSLETPTEGLEVVSRVVSSTSLSGYSKEICLRVPHSVQPVFDQTPKSFDVDSEEEEEEETPLVWWRKRVQGVNVVSVTVPDLEVVDTLHEATRDDEPTKPEKKIKRKEKGKMVDLQTIGEGKRRYVTRNET
ncbi:hypothetical protein KY290_036181 [Solanum tuberosum]|uniref:Uncharacterized protein n=1 Tax=Solanum tuberosum TaxID=4113 RepID=A0ABQ7TTJ4_SOLTU|nr:hypothetical protein KY285_035459 [Solanum tuberosum]KAH0737476.1 hypothetical protein KY290_036181 [Solanum tuberosum]